MAAAGTDDSLSVALADPAATEALGRRLGALMRAGDVVCLSGDLGAGKTTLARGAIAAWTGSGEEAPSPTYTLVQVYEGAKGALLHADLYRLKRPDEAEEIGLIDAFGREAVLIEWPERLAGALPKDRLEIALSSEGAQRRAHVIAHGAWRERAHGL
ncbi:MAG: tRNA (adenosine(37)-N6)-threonylcarbamoyltransferase complex ATPase subunit type 1 TsaE [Hyphomonadaceae bacterium]